MTEVTRMSRNRSCWSHMEDILHQFRFTEFGNVVPDETMVYSGHEYAEQNGKYALTVDPKNSNLIARVKKIINNSIIMSPWYSPCN